MCGEKEVKAQVKLSFFDTSGEYIVTTRSLQLTVKKNTRQQKTLEGTMQIKSRNGERSAISSRVAELDQLMPHHLGVSKAVLDFVIFCHQDESLWPMSEPAPLKKKFDEIFEALKYTKAIENIKALRKTKVEELKRLKDNEQYAKNTKSRADKAEKDSIELDAALNELRTEIRDHDDKAKDADKKYQNASDRAAEYTHILGKIENYRAKQEMLQGTLDHLSQDLEQRTESDEWLQSELNQFEDRMANHRKLEEQSLKQYQGLERSSKDAEVRLSSKHVEAGKYEEQKAVHEQQIQKRKELIVDTSHQHNLRGYDSNLDDMEINEYMDKIDKLLKDQNAAVEKARRETEREMKKAQDVLNKLGERKSVLMENRSAAKEQISANSSTLRAKQSELQSIEVDEGGKAILESKIEDVKVRLKQAKDDRNHGVWDTKIQEGEGQLREFDEEHGRINEDLIQATTQAGELAKLGQFKKDVADCQRNLDTMKRAHSSRLQSLIGHAWEPTRLEEQFYNATDERNRHLKEAEHEREKVSRGLEQFDYKISNAKEDLKKAENELATCTKILNASIDGEPEDFKETLSVLQGNRDLFKADFDNFENMKQYFAKALNVANGKEHKCNLCYRPLHGQELTRFVERMEKKLVQQTAEKVAQDLQEAEQDLRKAKEAGPRFETWSRLSKRDLPHLHEEIKKLSNEREPILRKLENHDKIVKDKEEAKIELASLTNPVTTIVKIQQDLTRFSSQIEDFTPVQDGSKAPQTLDETRIQLQSLQRKIQDTRNKVDKLRSDKERARSLISSLELDLSRANNNLSTAMYQLEKKQFIAVQVEELKKANQGHQESINGLEAKLQDLIPQYAEEETKLEYLRQRGVDRQNDLQRDASKLRESVQQLKLAKKNIEAYYDQGGPDKLSRCQRDIEGVEQDIAGIKDEQRQLTVSINKIKRELSNQESTKRTISNNIRYRGLLRDLESVKNKLQEESVKNDEADREHWQKQKSHWQRVLNQHVTDKTTKLGVARAKDDELARLLKDWNTDYKDADRNYKKAHIEVQVGSFLTVYRRD